MVNKHFFQKVSRTVYFKYYYGKDTADPDRPDVAPSVTHAGKDVNAGGPNGMLGDFKVDNKNSNTTTFIDSPQIENPTAEDNEILRAIVTGRDTDLVTGLVNNQGNENLGYISGATSIIQFPKLMLLPRTTGRHMIQMCPHLIPRILIPKVLIGLIVWVV